MQPSRILIRRLDIILALGFGLCLVLTTIGSLGQSGKSELLNENRTAAPFPKLDDLRDGWKAYFGRWESFYNDHLGFRRSLIAFDIKIRRTLFPADLAPSPNDLQGMLGRDGWLYLARDGDMDLVDDCQGMIRFSERQLKYAQTTLEARRDWLAARGTPYLLVIAPDKESVYAEHLPAWLKPAPVTRTDQFIEYLRLHSTVDVLDLRSSLRAARRLSPVYYQTDTHWNVMGAYVAGEAIVTRLSGRIPGLAPIDRNSFAIQRVPATGGDLAIWAGQPDIPEHNRYILIPGPNLPRLEFGTPQTNHLGLPQIWSTPVPGLYTIITKNPQGARQAIVFGDSFSVALEPFLGFHFGKVTGLWKPFDKSCVTNSSPDVVIEELVERHLDHLTGLP